MITRYEMFSSSVSSLSRDIQAIERMEMAKFGLKGPHAQCLLAMLRHPMGVTSTQLCELCAKDKAAISRTISELEQVQMIRRVTRNGNVYRAALLLTEKGRAAADAVSRRAKVAVEAAGADGVSLINTLLGMRIDMRKKKPLLANVTGGYSGAAVFPVALRMVYQVAGAVKIPVVGMGGVSSAEDVIEMMLAGATAVEVGAANLVNPYVCRDIIEQLPAAMDKYRINTLSEIIGGAK